MASLLHLRSLAIARKDAPNLWAVAPWSISDGCDERLAAEAEREEDEGKDATDAAGQGLKLLSGIDTRSRNDYSLTGAHT